MSAASPRGVSGPPARGVSGPPARGMSALAEPGERASQARATGTLLETRGLCKNFGALQVANSVEFRLEAGARHALIGPNGAGKTTFVNLLTGVLAPRTARCSSTARTSRGWRRQSA